MAAGRRVDAAAAILSAMDVPYLVAAPLLIQDPPNPLTLKP